MKILPCCCAIAFFAGVASLRAQSSSVYIEDLTWPEVQHAIATGKSTAVIYTGSTEQNGPHMAIGKHNFIARYVAGAIAIRLGNALVYPTMPFSITGDLTAKTGHMRFPGSVSLTPQTLRAVIHDVVLSALDAGFKNVVLMGDHGDGQGILAAVAADLDRSWQKKGARVFYIPDLYFKAKQQARAYEAAHGIKSDVHAGTDDTSELMALDTQHRWIRSDKLSAGTLANGVNGDPTKASTTLGNIFIEYKVSDAVSQIRKLTGAPRTMGLKPVNRIRSAARQ